jgi:hypothetical protein
VGDAEDFLEAGPAVEREFHAFLPEREPPAPLELVAQLVRRGAVMDRTPQVRGDFHDLVDARAALEAGVVTPAASRALPERAPRLALQARVAQDLVGRVVLGRARGADGPRQTLGHDAHDRAGEQVPLDAHVHEAGHGAGRVVGVERREHQVPGQRGLHRDARRFLVADLADHDDVRVLSQDAAERSGERQPDARPAPGSG